nr:hypothetical protein [uncultured Mediterranean phage uvMED]
MFKKFLKLLFPAFMEPPESLKPERSRDDRGRLVGDDIKTPSVNEAWVGGKAPAKKAAPKKRAAKKAAPKKRGRPPKAKK